MKDSARTLEEIEAFQNKVLKLLPDAQRDKIFVWLQICQSIDEARNVSSGIRRVYILKHLEKNSRGFSIPNITRKYYRYIKTFNFLEFIDFRSAPKEVQALLISRI